MKVRDIEYMTRPGEGFSDQVVACPVCIEVWIDPNKFEFEPCKHVMFMWTEGSEPTFYNRWNRRDFLRQYHRLYKKMVDEEATIQDASENPNEDVLNKMDAKRFPKLAEILTLTETGMACGPVSFTTYYGVRHD